MNIKFCFKLGKSATETYVMLKQVYGEQALSRSRTFEWYGRFRDGRESVEDVAHTGRPISVRTPETIEKVRKLVTADRRLSIRMLASELNIDKEVVRQILTQDLGKRKVCAKFVPHCLSDDQKQVRMDTCGELIVNADADLAFLDSIVTGDESWCYQYDPETKRQSTEWRSPSSPKQKKFRFQKSKIKVMLIAFFDSEGLIHHEFVPPGTTVTGQFYAEVLARLRQRIHRVRPRFRQNGSWFLLHDNARPHIALPVKRFLAKHEVVELHHPPYSPDLAPADFFLFPKLKTVIKGTRFVDVEDIKKNVTSTLKSIPKEDFKSCFQNLYKRAQKCITADGDYVETY